MLYLVRHGESEANRLDVHNGRNERLSARGIIEARMLANRLSGIGFDMAFVSPLRRARETAEHIVALHIGLDVHIDERLRECDNGELSGAPHGTRRAAALAQGIDPMSFCPNGGESRIQMIERVRRFWRELSGDRKSSVVLLVTHKGPIAVLVRELGAANPQEEWIAVKTGSLTIADTGRVPPVVLVDDTRHLEVG